MHMCVHAHICVYTHDVFIYVSMHVYMCVVYV